MLTVMILQHLLKTGQTPLGHSADAEKLCLLAEEVLRYRRLAVLTSYLNKSKLSTEVLRTVKPGQSPQKPFIRS